MERTRPSRRSLLKGLAAGALTLPALLRERALAMQPGEAPALVIVYLNGGPPGLFNSAGSFLERGHFGVKHDNVRDLGNGLIVDRDSWGSLPASALGHMATLNFRHGMYQHDLARAALMQTGDRSHLILAAQAIGRPAPIRCAVVDSLGLPVGVDGNAPAEGGITLERVLDLRAIGVFDGPLRPLADAYRVPPETSAIADTRASFLAAELLLRLGTSVVFVQPLFTGRPDRQIDTHGDSDGHEARNIMESILPSLRTFVTRALALPRRNVVIALLGEFSRTVGESDHEPGGSATVIGRYVKLGTAGALLPDGAPPPTSPPPPGLWSYLMSALRVSEHVFGANPNPELVLPA